MLGQRRRGWSNIKPTLVQCLKKVHAAKTSNDEMDTVHYTMDTVRFIISPWI